MKGSDVYSKVTLHKMGYVKGERGWFLKKDKAVVQPGLEIQSQGGLNVSQSQDAPIPAAPMSTSQQTPSHATTSMPDSNPTSSDSLSLEGVRRPSMIEGIFILVRGMKEDMRIMTMDSKLDDLQSKIEKLRSLVTQLRSQKREKTIGDMFLLLEVIMADMRTLRSKMDSVGSKINYLQTQLTEFYQQRQDWVKADKESVEWMIAETIAFQVQNRDIICRFETISSEIQDFWDCLSSMIR